MADVKSPNDIPEMDYSSLSDAELIELEKQYETEYIRYNTFQMAEKILLNSLYGALGTQYFRYYNLALAESVTNSGKLSIRWIERKLNELIDKYAGLKKDRIVLIDTDSVVLDLEDIVNKYCPDKSRIEKLEYINALGEKVINPFIEKSYQELAEYMNAYEQKMHMKRENVINTMISCEKKQYIMEVFDSEGVRYSLENPYMKIMGLELVKSSTPRIVRDSLKASTKILLHQTEKDLQNYVKAEKTKFKKHTIEDIAFPRGVSNISSFLRTYWEDALKGEGNPEEKAKIKSKLEVDKKAKGISSSACIKGTPFHVRASVVYNLMLDRYGLSNVYKKIVDGDKIKLVCLKPQNPIGEEWIAFTDSLPKEFGLEKYVDYDTMFAKAFESSLKKMSGTLGWSIKPKNDLNDLFGMYPM